MKRIIAIVLLVVIASACGPAPVPEPTKSPLSPVATPQAAQQATLNVEPIPTSRPGYGAVTGRLVSQETGKPLDNRVVYLGPIVEAADGNFSVASLDKSSPRFSTDGQGGFVFTDVLPGRYGLIMDALMETVLLADLTTGKDIVVVVAPDKTVDLGKIEVLPNH
jgi:hypothetical protein